MARVPKMACGKMFLSRVIRFCPNFFKILLPYQLLYMGRICVYVHISDCLEIVYELPVLPSNTASETYVYKLEAVPSADWIFIFGVPAWR